MARFNNRTGLYELEPGDVGYPEQQMGAPYSYAQSRMQVPPPQQPQSIDVAPFGSFDPYDQDFEELLQGIQPDERRFDPVTGQLISEFDVRPGEDDLDFLPPDPVRPGYMGQDPTPGLPGDPVDPGRVTMIGGVAVNQDMMQRLQEAAAQGRVDQEVAGIDAALGDPLSLQGTPTAAPVVGQTQSRSLAATPERQAEAATVGDPRTKQLSTQLAVAGGIGAVQAAIPLIQRFGLLGFGQDPAIKEAERTKDQFVEGQAGEEAYRATMGAGRAAINRQAQLSRQVQEDIAAASGATDVRRQEQIRDAAADAFTKEEAELEANARELAARADAESLGEFRSAIAYLSQANNAVAQSTMQALGQFAPVAAALDVNRGYKEYSKDIQNLPEEFQDMFYAYSMNAKSTDELARLYAYVKQRAAAAETAQASATQDTAQNTEA
tara:strand:- start:6744 stop:8054 length:1311 start_codon:yes stop_codon:yes gene_type:complete